MDNSVDALGSEEQSVTIVALDNKIDEPDNGGAAGVAGHWRGRRATDHGDPHGAILVAAFQGLRGNP